MNETRRGSTVRVGLFGIGLDTYWEQFNGLKERLLGQELWATTT